jgi:hypothetical protein
VLALLRKHASLELARDINSQACNHITEVFTPQSYDIEIIISFYRKMRLICLESSLIPFGVFWKRGNIF